MKKRGIQADLPQFYHFSRLKDIKNIFLFSEKSSSHFSSTNKISTCHQQIEQKFNSREMPFFQVLEFFFKKEELHE